MKNLGQVFAAVGLMIVVAAAIGRRVWRDPADYEAALGFSRGLVLPAMLIGFAVFCVGAFMGRKTK